MLSAHRLLIILVLTFVAAPVLVPGGSIAAEGEANQEARDIVRAAIDHWARRYRPTAK